MNEESLIKYLAEKEQFAKEHLMNCDRGEETYWIGYIDAVAEIRRSISLAIDLYKKI